MFIFDAPYISDVAERFLTDSQHPVLANAFSQKFISEKANRVSEEEALRLLEQQGYRWLYSSSENAISWITEKLGSDSLLTRNIELFKNKFKFREATRHLSPDLTYLKVSADELADVSFEQIGTPFIIKPVVGFISAGVHRVNNPQEWLRIRDRILSETESVAAAFPNNVLNSSAFLIESIIEGEEYAVDAYFNEDNTPVVLNIMHHRFSSDYDMSDRLYVTSAEIIRQQLGPIERFLSDMAQTGDYRGMPLHVEVRIDEKGRVTPIEVNPLRFAGWCSTDIAWYAYSLNVYHYFAHKKTPDWNSLLAEKKGKTYAMGLIERAEPVDERCVFDYEGLRGEFSSLLALREIDYRTFPLYAFVFFEVSDENIDELEGALSLDPKRFLTSKEQFHKL